MNSLLEKPVDASAFSPLALAFLGDTVFDLLTRSDLLTQANRPVNDLHQASRRRARAGA